MLFLTRLAFKNLARHRNRTVITSIIIAFAVLSYILYDSLIGGMIEMSYATITDYETGHLQVMTREYWEKETEEKELPWSISSRLMRNWRGKSRRSRGFWLLRPN